MINYVTRFIEIIMEWAEKHDVPLALINSLGVALILLLIVIVVCLFCANAKKKKLLSQSDIKIAELDRQLAKVRHEYNLVCMQNVKYYNEICRKDQKADYRRKVEEVLASDLAFTFTKKEDVMYRSEKKMYGYIYEFLSRPPYKGKYIVFPQVSLYTYIQPNEDELNDYERKVAFGLLGGKNTDFLICEITTDGRYAPRIAVEINGPTHDVVSGYKRTVENDRFKAALFRDLGIHLVSHTLGSRLYIQDEIKPYL